MSNIVYIKSKDSKSLNDIPITNSQWSSFQNTTEYGKYKLHIGTKEQCSKYALINGYPFYFSWDPDSDADSIPQGVPLDSRCLFRIDSSLSDTSNLDFDPNEYNKKKENLNTYWQLNTGLRFFLYELSPNEIDIDRFKINNPVKEREISNGLSNLISSYENFSNESDNIPKANKFGNAYKKIKRLKENVDNTYYLNDLIEFRKAFTLIVKKMDEKIHNEQKQLDKILLIDGANNGKLQDIKFMNFFTISKSFILILVLLISSRYIIKYKK